MIKLKIFNLSIILIWLTYANMLFAQQNSILYVGAKTSPTIPEISTISKKIDENITTKIPLVKSKKGYINYNSNTPESNASNFKTITNSSIQYVLKLSITKVSSLYELHFSFYYIDITKQVQGKKILEDQIVWDNSTYIVRKEMNGSFANIDDILSDINSEIDFYLKSGKFRPRIYIAQNLFSTTDAISKIQFNNFCLWLEKAIQTTNRTDRYNYVIYYKSKKIYPEKASAMLYAEFIPIQNDETRINVVLKIENNTGAKYSKPSVKIFIDDFNQGTYKHEDTYKQDLLTYIYELVAKDGN